jgi:phosphatidylserine decarboxylase
MKLTHYGIREWLGGGIICLLLLAGSVLIAVFADVFAGVSLSVIFVLLWFAIAAFFRDPERVIPEGDNMLVSPADGHVRDIEIISAGAENEYFGGRNVIRVGIFLSVFDVHLNRAPCQLRIRERIYRKGRFHDARDPLASAENEAMTIVCDADAYGKAFTLVVRQISGAIAKRIVCPAEPGTVFSKGEIYGMIKFGSRTELFFPASSDFELKVKIGDRVHAGTSIMAEIKNKTE